MQKEDFFAKYFDIISNIIISGENETREGRRELLKGKSPGEEWE